MIKNLQDQNMIIDQLKKTVDAFIVERDWKKFHSPKNLSAKLSIEAAELLEKFVWLTDQQSIDVIDTNRQEIEHEVADVFILLLSFCNVAKIDLSSAMLTKLEEVRAKYPIAKCKGIATKYNKL
jgi:NTP pyrophosphatase (non-canonical NTP hydrolase)